MNISLTFPLNMKLAISFISLAVFASFIPLAANEIITVDNAVLNDLEKIDGYAWHNLNQKENCLLIHRYLEKPLLYFLKNDELIPVDVPDIGSVLKEEGRPPLHQYDNLEYFPLTYFFDEQDRLVVYTSSTAPVKYKDSSGKESNYPQGIYVIYQFHPEKNRELEQVEIKEGPYPLKPSLSPDQKWSLAYHPDIASNFTGGKGDNAPCAYFIIDESKKKIAAPLAEQWHISTDNITYPENIEWNHDSSGVILTTLVGRSACTELYCLQKETWNRIPVELSDNQRQFVDASHWLAPHERMTFEGDTVLKIRFGFKGYKEMNNSDEIRNKLPGFLDERQISLVWDAEYETYTGLLIAYQKDKKGNYAWTYKTWTDVKKTIGDFLKRYSSQP